MRHQGGSKFLKKTYPCVFIGYSPIHKGYRCLEPKTKHVYISKHVMFDEMTFPYKTTQVAVDSQKFVFSEFPSSDEWIGSKDSLNDAQPNVENSEKSNSKDFISTTSQNT